MSQPINYRICFRLISLANAAIVPLLILGLIFIEEQFLPAELTDIGSKYHSELGEVEVIILCLIYVTYTASSIGIIFLKNWAKYSFTCLLAIMVFSTIYYREPLIGSWVFDFFNDIALMLQGAILVYLWSPLWALENKKNVEH
jgi:hypothetical protein